MDSTATCEVCPKCNLNLDRQMIEDEIDYFLTSNPAARQAEEKELLELWRRWIIQRVPNRALAQMTIKQVIKHR